MGQEMYLAVENRNELTLIDTALYFDKDGLDLRQTAEINDALPFQAFLSGRRRQHWFEPAEGLKTVQTLSNHLHNLFPDPGKADLVKGCLESLQEIQQSLLAAQQNRAKFHFAFTPEE